MKKVYLMILILGAILLYSCDRDSECYLYSYDIILDEHITYYTRLNECGLYKDEKAPYDKAEEISDFNLLSSGHVITPKEIKHRNLCEETIRKMSCEAVKEIKHLSEVEDCLYFDHLEGFMPLRRLCINFYYNVCEEHYFCKEDGKSGDIPVCDDLFIKFEDDRPVFDGKKIDKLCEYIPKDATIAFNNQKQMEQLKQCHYAHYGDHQRSCPQSDDDLYTKCEIYRPKNEQ